MEKLPNGFYLHGTVAIYVYGNYESNNSMIYEYIDLSDSEPRCSSISKVPIIQIKDHLDYYVSVLKRCATHFDGYLLARLTEQVEKL